MFDYKLVVIIGNVGSGKSTVSKMLAKKLGAKLVPADKFFEINPFFPLALEDRKRWSLASDLWFLKERVKLIKQTLLDVENQDVVVDSGIPMSLMYANSRLSSGFFTEEEWKLYESIYNELTRNVPKPEVVVYMRATVDFVREQIEKRGREFEVKHHDGKYLTSLEESLEYVARKLKSEGVKVVVWDVERQGFASTAENLEMLAGRINLMSVTRDGDNPCWSLMGV